MKSVSLLILALLLTSCLKTRSELSGANQSSLRTGSDGNYVTGNIGQQQRAQIDSRFFEIDRDFRELYGKIEVLERKLADNQSQDMNHQQPSFDNSQIEALNKRISTLEEAILSIDKKLTNRSGGDKTSSTSVDSKPKGPFGYGEKFFAEGKFTEAITSYDTYRKRYPKGTRYAQATLKMGLSFQKLKMNQDAKSFYKEVIQRYPNTRVSNVAEENLKRL